MVFYLRLNTAEYKKNSPYNVCHKGNFCVEMLYYLLNNPGLASVASVGICRVYRGSFAWSV